MSYTPKDKLFIQIQKGIHQCHDCPLCASRDAVHVTFRGSPEAKVWLVGEAPGRREIEQRKPFVGPAGQILNKMIWGLGYIENDFYITNVVKGHSSAPEGSGRENVPPGMEIIRTCRRHFDSELAMLKPKIICLMGGSAVKAFYDNGNLRVGDYVGKAEKISGPGGSDLIVYCMYHPAYLLHSKKSGEKEYQRVRLEMWEQAKQLRTIIKETLDE